ncbi:MAG: hypothetical protein GY759_19875 [Chloroflexi bacterium]|nr:hypothetical protein [Chloroflexota bacterium]
MYEPTAVAARRKAYLALAKRRSRPGSGSSRAHLHRRTSRQTAPDLRSIFQEVPFVVVGAIAARLYMPERMTYDTDVLVLVDDQAACENRLEQAGCRKLGNLAIGGASWELVDGAELDVIFSKELWAYEAINEPNMADTGLPTIALSYLVLMKLLSGRAQDIADITRMLGAADDAMLEGVRAVVARHAPDAAEDVESMIELGKMEYE